MATRFELVVPGDRAEVPGMRMLPADRRETHKVHCVGNVPYAERPEEKLFLHLLMPDGLMPGGFCERHYPLVVFVQGAAWGEQDMFMNLPQLCRVAQEGYVVASVKHRAAAKARFPAFLQDVKSAIRYLRANAEKLHVDPDRIVVWGDSSGGHAALMAGVTGDDPAFRTADNEHFSDAVQAVIDFYGPTDVTRINETPRNPVFTADKSSIPEDILFGGCVAEHPEIAQPGNPLNYVDEDKKLPPFLIVHGDSDAMVPFRQSLLMAEKLRACGQTVDFYKVCGADHGVFLWTDEVMNLVVSFLRAHIG